MTFLAKVLFLGCVVVVSVTDLNDAQVPYDEIEFTILIPNENHVKKSEEILEIFCYEGVSKSIFQIWRSVHFKLLNKPKGYKLFHGVNHTEVRMNYESRSRWQPYFLFGSLDTDIDFPAFSQSCVGIETKETYVVHLQVRILNFWKALLTFSGVCLFLSASTLSRNSFFHYAAGIIFGVLASLLIILYVISRFMPRKSLSYLVIGFGSSFLLYLLKLIWHHFYEVITNYMDFIISYCLISAFLSFVVCYKLGPVENSRTKNIIQWSMQALSCLVIFFSSEYREISTTIILVLLIGSVIPEKWMKWPNFIWYRCFPPKVKFLTELEYIEQGNIETKKALENLRQFCNSPDCNAWKVVSTLKDPVRFANFIETGSHYTDEELLEYNSEDLNSEFWDPDENNSDDESHNIANGSVH